MDLKNNIQVNPIYEHWVTNSNNALGIVSLSLQINCLYL
jgi:hypothetical protein